MYDGGRQGLPMYDVRCTTEALGAPMYEVRCTKYDLGSERALRGNFAKQAQTGCPGAMVGGGGRRSLHMYDGGAWRAYVRGTMYDVRLRNSRVGRGIVMDGMAKKSRRWGQHRREKNESWDCYQILPKRDLPSERRSDVATLRRSQMPCSPFLR